MKIPKPTPPPDPKDQDTLQHQLHELELLRQQRNQSEERFRRFDGLLQLIADTQHLLFQETDRERIIQDFCEMLIAKKVYAHAWLVLLDAEEKPWLWAQAGLSQPLDTLMHTMQQGTWPSCIKNAHERYAILSIQDPAFVCGPCALSPDCQRHAQLVINIGYSHRVYGVLIVALPRIYLAHEEEKHILRLLADSVGAAFFRLECEPEAEASQSQLRQFVVLQSAMDALATQLVCRDRHQRIRWCNISAAHMWGLTPDQTLGKKTEDLAPHIDPLQLIESRDVHAAVLESGIPQRHIEETWWAQETPTRWWIADRHAYRQPDGSLGGVVEIHTDISELKKNEDAVKASESFYRLISDRLSDTIWVIDPQMHFLYVNPAVFRALPTPPKQVFNLGFKALLTPESFQTLQTTLSELETQIADPEQTWITSPPLELEFKLTPESSIWQELVWHRLENVMGQPNVFLGVGRDIQERKRIEFSLRENQQKYQHLVESGSDWIWELDINLNFTYVSPQVEKIIGYPCEGLLQRSPMDFMPPEEGLRITSILKEYISQRSPFSLLQCTMRHRNETLRILEVSGTPVTALSGEVVGLRGVARDITEHKFAEEALLDSESRFRGIFSVSPLALALCDPEGKLVDVNQSFLDLFGALLPGTLPGSHFLPSLDLPENAMDDLQQKRIIHYELMFDFETAHIKLPFKTLRHGSVNLDILISPFAWERTRDDSGFLIQLEDITERKLTEEALLENEAKYRTLFDSSAVGFLLLSDSFIDCNAEALRLWQCERTSVIGQTPLDFSPPQQPDGTSSQEGLREHLSHAFEGYPQNFYWQFQRTDRTCIDTDVSFKLISVNGSPMIIMAMRDITEQKHAEAAYHQAMSRFEAIIENTPRVAIQGFDRTGVIQHWNRASESLYGFSSPGILGQKIQSTLFAGSDTTAFDETIEKVWATRLPSQPQEWKLNKPDGNPVWVYSSMFPIVENDRVVEIFCMDVDITERKQAEEAMRLSEEKYRTIFENSGNALMILNEDMSIALVNREMENLGGYSLRESQVTFQWHDVVANSEDLKKMLHYHRQRRVDPDSVPKTYECDFRHKDGSIRHIILTATLIPSTSQTLVAFLDITERKHSEEELRCSEEKYRATFESSGSALMVLDESLTILLVNREFEKLSAFPRKDLEGKIHGTVFFPDPVEREYFLEQHRSTAEMTDPSPQTLELHFQPKTGNLRDVLATFTYLPASRQSLVGLTDITERKLAERKLMKSERRYRLLADNVKDIIWTMDQNRKLTYISPSVEALTGFSVEEALARDASQTFTPDSYQKLIQLMGHFTVADSTSSHPIELEQFHKNGSTLWIEMQVTPMHDPDGKTLGFVGVTRDISARRQADLERQQLEDQLRQSQKMEIIGHLAGGIAHDFNNLLTPILGYADMVSLQVPAGSALYNDIQAIRETAERAARLTRQLLAFSLKQVLHMTIVNLNEEIHEFIKMLHPLLGEHIEVRTELTASLGPIKADVSQLQQVLMNLAVNARDAMPRGGTLTFTTSSLLVTEELLRQHPTLSLGEHICLTVRDTGTGIPKEIMEHIFEPFFTTKERGKGTGLGLSMVYGIITQHHGTLWAESEYGQGTCMHVVLPRCETPNVEPIIPASPSLPLSGHAAIWVVEDEPMVRKMTQEILVNHGYSVQTASTPSEALDRLQQSDEPIDLLLTDIIMPGMNGKELFQQLKQKRSNLKALYMSGYSEDVIAHHGVLDPGIHLIAKPFSVKDLLANVHRVLTE